MCVFPPFSVPLIIYITVSHTQVQLWLNRAVRFHTFCEEVNRCFDNLTTIPNRQLLYDLYQYMSDARETTMLLDSYISWLGKDQNKL